MRSILSFRKWWIHQYPIIAATFKFSEIIINYIEILQLKYFPESPGHFNDIYLSSGFLHSYSYIALTSRRLKSFHSRFNISIINHSFNNIIWCREEINTNTLTPDQLTFLFFYRVHFLLLAPILEIFPERCP